jgi:hypothetical protein
MRTLRLSSIVVYSTLALIVPAVLPAQGFRAHFGGPFHEQTKTGAPYSATRTVKTVQTLANGNTITHVTTINVARDSSGRVYTQAQETLPAGANGQSREVVHSSIFDPVAHTTTSWHADSKVAVVFHHPDRSSAANSSALTPDAAHAEPVDAQSPRPEPFASDAQRVELGTKTIQGDSATGTRLTHVIPAGRLGNSQPITVTSETWRSADLGIVLSSTHTDPRRGTTTEEVTDLKQGEPDASLFKVPEGYTVQDRTAQRFQAQ